MCVGVCACGVCVWYVCVVCVGGVCGVCVVCVCGVCVVCVCGVCGVCVVCVRVCMCVYAHVSEDRTFFYLFIVICQCYGLPEGAQC